MSVLLLQTFLLILGAFLLGAASACIIRRFLRSLWSTVPIDTPDTTLTTAALGTSAGVGTVAAAEDAYRFERALTGDAPPPPFQTSGEPVIEVQRFPEPVPLPPATELPTVPPPVDLPEPQFYSDTAGAQADTVSYSVPEPVVPEPVIAPEPAPEPEPVVDLEAPTEIVMPVVSSPVVEPVPEPDVAPAPQEAEVTDTSSSGFADMAGMGAATAAAAAAAAAAAVVAPVTHEGDDLTRISAIDRDTEQRLKSLGVLHYSDIAIWSAEDITRYNQSLGYYGRIENENWVGQAQILSRGGDPSAAPVLPDPEDAPDAPTAPSESVVTYASIAAAANAAMTRDVDAASTADTAVETTVTETAVSETARTEPDPSPAMEVQPEQPSTDYSSMRSVRSESLVGTMPPPLPPSVPQSDDLKRIRGVGVLIEKRLNALGITSYEQVANWTSVDVDRISDILDFKGRIQRENWIEQARILVSGGHTDFSRRVDRGES